MTPFAAPVAAGFVAPTIEYGKLSPLIIVFGAAAIGVLVEAFVPRRFRYLVQVVLSAAAMVGGLVAVALLAGTNAVTAMGAVSVDGFSLFTWGLLLALTLITVGVVAERALDGGVMAFAAQASAMQGTAEEREAVAKRLEQTEVFPLLLFSLGGMMLFPAANDLLTMFVGLEVLSLPLYLMCGLARRRRLLSQEAALKYFLLGAFSSAFFLYGIALLYGYAGTVSFGGIATALTGRAGADPLLLAGVSLVAIGVLFKVAAAPFHMWTPDVYEGAPTSITGFMAACTKIAAFGALLRLFYVALGPDRWDWQPMMWVVAIITMFVGSVLAILQSDIKRLLAYSSIAHAGFVLVGFVGIRGDLKTNVAAVLFYLVSYGFTTIGAFALVTVVRDPGGEATGLARWNGVGRRSPLVGGVMALFLLSFAGIPLTAGFMGKWAVFSAAWVGGAWPLVIIAVLASVVTVFYYVRVIVRMFFGPTPEHEPVVAIPSALTTFAVTVGVAATVVLGVVPGPVFELAARAATLVS